MFPLFKIVIVGMLALILSGCSNSSDAAIETDANGYYCQQCHAKIFTDRKVFLEKCPKCKADALVEVVGYLCPRDHHLTLRPKTRGPEGAAVCEQCGAPLDHALVQPHREDLKTWGATKAES